MIPPRLLTEFIGTFFLVLVIGLAVAFAGTLAPVVIGLALAVLVYMGGHVSGAQYNPAVSIGLWLRGTHDLRRAASCIIAQIAGGLLGALLSKLLTNAPMNVQPAVGASLSAVLAVEVIFTFLLVLVVLNVATHPKTTGNSYYGFAIGGAVLVGAFAGGPISGGAFNPAVGLCPAIVSMVTGQGAGFGQAWVYLVGPIVGSALAVAVFKAQLKGD
jgi:aquaporin Z